MHEGLRVQQRLQRCIEEAGVANVEEAMAATEGGQGQEDGRAGDIGFTSGPFRNSVRVGRNIRQYRTSLHEAATHQHFTRHTTPAGQKRRSEQQSSAEGGN
jgi:hypothetical protein